MTPNMNFTIEEETNNSINFLGIIITNKHDHLSFTVYRKPTTTATIIPNDSCHPVQHKLAAIRFLTNRRDAYSLDDTNKQIENKIINQILRNNKYDFPPTQKPPKPITPPENPALDMKWARFTYFYKETRFITKLFRHTSIKVAYTTRNTLNKLLLTHNPPTQGK
jgi:hypothetical protein